mmetsp:Transcript_23582/g.22728  ORF Transcript_23582/g.22728 Transcript_23582/m.22728 type:complete len:780 (-) Transcript_23582:114-2453(-)|eukprot:CAMPEP_0119045346 /NCGR_PEP_ID=MMETSP1177-20130426/39113_1 /TAXON_ID=2985 /ORGANISM="Ochromonas sp, Strain CCMP1899" /LENGTH=779 /DNA_ID=CAMNT_0007016963 /DNA_START=56 /DNA_END=2395 /DNA_ORIENTATION=+
MSKPDESVKVVVRIRPMSAEEERNGNLIAAEAFPDRGLIVVRNPKASDSEPPKNFSFDSVFASSVEQKHIYDTCAAGVVDSVLSGYNGTIFAYGQTGAGKTHTMEGRPDPPFLRGIIPNSFQHIFDHISSASDFQFLVRASYLEIYNEEIRDLLSKDPKNSLELKENLDTGVYVKDLTSFVVKNVTEIDHVMQAGKKNRSTGATLMNQTSSRSHSIFTIVIECMDLAGKGDHIRVGKLNLVDLAGSERQSKTGATGDRLKEATKINLSLAALGNVISALVDGKSSHIPYRDSKLTRLLQNSLGGNAKTVMCANCGPADYNYDETLSTLRYANRAKNIKNKPKINEDPKDAMLREYQDEIKKLKDQLNATQRGVIIGDDGKELMVTDAQKEIIERIIEREVIKEVRVGISEEEMEQLTERVTAEKQILMKQAQDDMRLLIDQQSRTAQERAELQAALDREAEDRAIIEEQKQKLAAKLKAMEEKLIKGGEVISKASKQEGLLRKAEKELRERQQEEARLARELAEKEEANLQLEEHFSSLQEEVEVKTKKLKKLWATFQGAVREQQDLQEEFQTDRSDMLDTIRQLSRTVKLKDVVIHSFIPEDTAKVMERRAIWSAEDEAWTILKINLAGNNIRSAKFPSSQHGFKKEGIAGRVDHTIGDDGEEISFIDSGIPKPYLLYGSDAGGPSTSAIADKEERSKEKGSSSQKQSRSKKSSKGDGLFSSSSGKEGTKEMRPKSATKKRDGNVSLNNNRGSGDPRDELYPKSNEELYPTARGLIRK